MKYSRFGTRGLLRKYETARFSTPQLDQIVEIGVRTITEGNDNSFGVSGCKGEAVVEPPFKRGDIM